MARIHPPKLIFFYLSNPTTVRISPDPDYPTTPIQYHVSLQVFPQQHDDPRVNPTAHYDGTNIKVGDWISMKDNSYTYRVVSVDPGATDVSVGLVIEDVDLFNQISSQNADNNPLLTAGNGLGILFELGSDGLPILDPVLIQAHTLGVILPPAFNTDVMAEIMAWFHDTQSRFRFRNYLTDYYDINSVDATIAVGDFVYINYDIPTATRSFVKITAANQNTPDPNYNNTTPLQRAFGTVTFVDYDNRISVRPFGRIVSRPGYQNHLSTLILLSPIT